MATGPDTTEVIPPPPWEQAADEIPPPPWEQAREAAKRHQAAGLGASQIPSTGWVWKPVTHGLPAMGATIGTLAGPAGAALGGAGGKGFEITINSLLDPAEAAKHSGLKGTVGSYIDMSKEALKQGAFVKGTELALKPFSYWGGKLLERYERPIQTAIRQAAESLGQKLKGIEKVGDPLTRTEVIVKRAGDALRNLYTQVSTKSAPVGQAGEEVANAIDLAEESFHKAFKVDYDALDTKVAQLSKGKPRVDSDEVRQFFKDMKEPVHRRVEAAAPESAGPTAFARGVRTDVADLPNLDFATARQLKSKWLQVARETEDSSVKAEANRAALALDRAMENTAKKYGVADEWRALDAAYQQGKKLYDSAFIERALRNDPETIIKAVGNQAPSKAIKIRDALLTPGNKSGYDAWKTFQRSYAERLAQGSGATMEGGLENLSKSLAKAGPETLDIVFGGDPIGQRVLKTMQEAATVIDGFKAIDTSHAFLASIHQGMHAGFGAFFRIPMAAIDRAASWMFVKIAETPIASKILIDGLVKMPKDFAAGVALVQKAAWYTAKALRYTGLSRAAVKLNASVPSWLQQELDPMSLIREKPE